MILDHTSFGAVLRVFAKDPALAKERAEQAVRAATTLSAIVVEGKKLFKRIDILVASDDRFSDCGCGETIAHIRASLSLDERVIFASEVKHGDLFCGLLNYGIAHQVRTAKIDYTAIISPEAVSYATPHVISGILEAAGKKAKAIGVAFGDLTQSVREGRLANTFCFWHNQSLQTVGGFDLKASAAKKEDRQTMYLKGYSETKKAEVFYAYNGVEEIIPLIRLIELFDQCIAVVNSDQGEWRIPTPDGDPEAYDRHCKKMGTKFERQSAFAFATGADLSYLRGGLMG